MFPEHEFLLSCFRIGAHINDLERLTYVDVLKMFLPFSKKTKKEDKIQQATQKDINRILK